jgi:hypothetical protein
MQEVEAHQEFQLASARPLGTVLKVSHVCLREDYASPAGFPPLHGLEI